MKRPGKVIMLNPNKLYYMNFDRIKSVKKAYYSYIYV